VDLVYDQWTQFADFPRFMKKLEQVEQISDEKLRWKAQVFWSHRSWESTILEQVQDERIVWRSKGDKGYLDGAVTFHELTPDLTRVLVVIEYHPQGFFEKTGNIWRAQGRRIRLELKHFRRQVMIQTLLHPDDVEGWHGEIRDGEVVPEEDLDEEPEDEDTEGDACDGALWSASNSSRSMRVSWSPASTRTYDSRRRSIAWRSRRLSPRDCPTWCRT
ncbi:SRPBCC family protein, partial [Prescottella equi]|uniref:SRPBCC family protein n=1 Tax=Rhodococcus hoagii TaxID=43767 RepID=UPI001F164926